jgi:hypothetical protein
METPMRRTLIMAVAGLLCLAPFVNAQEPASQEKTGLKVGQKAPAFKLRDQTDKQQTFDDLAKNADYVALVFYRSANW